MKRLALALVALGVFPSCHDEHAPFGAPRALCSQVPDLGSGACEQCVAQNYCTVLANCDDKRCDDPWDHTAIVAAETNDCAAECAGGAFAFCGGFHLATDACTNCLTGDCCDVASQCAQSGTCLSLVYQCVSKLGRSYDDCASTPYLDSTSFQAFIACGRANCPSCF